MKLSLKNKILYPTIGIVTVLMAISIGVGYYMSSTTISDQTMQILRLRQSRGWI